jgi:L-amino acid N-acyltransferase YncA
MTLLKPALDVFPKTVMLRNTAEVVIRPLAEGDKVPLLGFFSRIPEEERFYLKENVTSPEVIQAWTTDIDFRRVMPIVATIGNQVIADATLHRSRASSRQHIGELRVVVDPAFRELGLGGRLIKELLVIATSLGLHKLMFELASHEEEAAIVAAGSAGFREVVTLKEQVRDMWGNFHDVVLMELFL